MCYLKNILSEESTDVHLWGSKEEESFDTYGNETNMLVPCKDKWMGAEWTEEQQKLVKIFETVEKNNKVIQNINRIIRDNSEYLGKLLINIENPIKPTLKKEEDLFPAELIPNTAVDNTETLATKLFGSRNYKFKLQLAEKIDCTLYKERNFNLKVKLVSNKNEIIRNCNLVTLCLAVCSMNAEWLHENRVGEPFLKGKTELELFRGESVFQKIYARDVSRGYPEGKLAIVIYPKPSMLKYHSQGLHEEIVNSEEIEPLVFDNITIKAKRKE